MMHPLFGMQPAGSLPVTYPYDAMVDDHSRQMACSQAARRFSRGSNGQRSGGAMRVVKPNSASNSPRSSGVMARRKTLMNDGNSQRRRQQVLDQLSMFYDTEQQPAQRSSRPVSWHPSSYGQQPQAQAQQPMYALTSSNMYANQQDNYGSYPHVSPMLASTSCDTSPLAFSHLSLPYQAADNLPYYPYQGTSMAQQSPASCSAMGTRQVSVEASAPNDNAAYGTGWDWNSFIMHGFNATTPPTPETLPQAELSQPAVSDDIPYQALEEPLEEEGEILVGMGLYDTPDKYEEDPQLNNYRSTVSSLLGSTFRGHEPRGKGLKLEETWEPPKSDEEEEEEDDDDDDDDDDEEEGQDAS